jgi:hypothetical protein
MAYKYGGKMYVEYPLDNIVKIKDGPVNTSIYAIIEKKRKFKMKFDGNFGPMLRELIGDRLPD